MALEQIVSGQAFVYSPYLIWFLLACMIND
jgi:hypothetical protein